MRVLIVSNFTDWNFKTHVKWHSEPFGRTLNTQNSLMTTRSHKTKWDQVNSKWINYTNGFTFMWKHTCDYDPRKYSLFFAFPAKSIKTKTTIENRNKIIKIAINLIRCTKLVYGYSVILSIVIILNSRTISKSLLK